MQSTCHKKTQWKLLIANTIGITKYILNIEVSVFQRVPVILLVSVAITNNYWYIMKYASTSYVGITQKIGNQHITHVLKRKQQPR